MDTRLAVRLRRLADVITPVAAGLLLALLVTACHSGSTTGTSSAAAASARAEASSSAGVAAKTQAEAIADDCKPAGTAGFNVLEPGVPGASAARKAFETCEKIPKAKVFALGICLGKAYSHAPAKGASGSAAEIARQAYLAGAEGACVQIAKGKEPVTAPASVPTAAKAATPSVSTK